MEFWITLYLSLAITITSLVACGFAFVIADDEPAENILKGSLPRYLSFFFVMVLGLPAFIGFLWPVVLTLQVAYSTAVYIGNLLGYGQKES